MSATAYLLNQSSLAIIDDKLDVALEKLHQAAHQDPRSPVILSDQAAVYLARATRSGSLFDILQAFSVSQTALSLNRHCKAAQFNAALSLESLFLYRRARDAWLTYLKLDSNSGWAREAEAHIRRLNHLLYRQSTARDGMEELKEAISKNDLILLSKLVSRHPWSVRKFVEETVMPQWSEAYLKGDMGAAANNLHIAQIVSNILKGTSGDNFLSESITSSAQINGKNRSDVGILALGQQHYKLGRHKYSLADYGDAQKLLALAADEFRAARSPFWLKAKYLEACSLIYQSKYRRAQRILEPVENSALKQGYIALRGEALWMLGVVTFYQQRPTISLRYFYGAREVFTDLRETENILAINNIIAELLDYQGARQESWAYRQEALALSAGLDDPLRLYQAYFINGASAWRMGEFSLALYFQEEALRFARKLNNPAAVCSSLFWLSRYRQRLGQQHLALRDIREGLRESLKLKGAIKSRVTADLLLSQGEAELQAHPRKAYELTEKVLRDVDNSNHFYNLVEIYLLRARASILLGDTVATKRDLEMAVQLIENWHSKLDEPLLRLSFGESKKSIFQTAISFYLHEEAEPLSALSYLERQRNQEYKERLAEMPFAVFSRVATWSRPSLAFSALPPRVHFLVFSFLEGGNLGVWTGDKEGVKYSATLPDAIRINELVRQYKRVMARKSTTFQAQRLASLLYDILIPVSLRPFQAGDTLIICADGELRDLPFGTLLSPMTGRFLMEDFALVRSPSIEGFVLGQQRIQGEDRNARILIISGSNNMASGSSSALPSLSIEEEARAVSSAYAKADVMLGATTKTSFLSTIKRYDSVHFIGHAVVNRRAPLWSYLLFNGDDEQSRLYAYDVYNIHERLPALLVLSSCSTSSGIEYRQGVGSLVDAFITAGIVSVVASYNQLDDRGAVKFMEVFHRFLATTNEPWVALRKSQLYFLRGQDKTLINPSFWGNFNVTTGSHTTVGRHYEI